MKKTLLTLLVILLSVSIYASNITLESGYIQDLNLENTENSAKHNIPLKANLMLDLGSYSLGLGAGAFFNATDGNTGLEVDFLNYYRLGIGGVFNFRLGGGLIYTFTPEESESSKTYINVFTLAAAMNMEVIVSNHLSLNLNGFLGYNILPFTIIEPDNYSIMNLNEKRIRWGVSLAVGNAF